MAYFSFRTLQIVSLVDEFSVNRGGFQWNRQPLIMDRPLIEL